MRFIKYILNAYDYLPFSYPKDRTLAHTNCRKCGYSKTMRGKNL